MKQVKGFESLYSVDENGNVYSSYRSRKILSPKIDRYGYKCVTLRKNGGSFYFTIHKIVALSYLSDSYFEGAVVNHKDCNKLNNSPTNLEWVTALQNTAHAKENKRCIAWNKGKTDVYSSDVVNAIRANQPHKKQIHMVDSKGNITVFASIRELCRVMNFDRRTATRVAQGKPNYNTIQGYKLQYNEAIC